MRSRTRSKREAGKLYSEYCRNLARRDATDGPGSRLDAKAMLSPDITDYFRRATPGATQRLIAKRHVVEFGFGVLCDYARAYARLYPHAVLGRYPKRLDGDELTTDIYASQENSVLYSLHVTIRHDHERLCEHASLLDELCELGHEREYW